LQIMTSRLWRIVSWIVIPGIVFFTIILTIHFHSFDWCKWSLNRLSEDGLNFIAEEATLIEKVRQPNGDHQSSIWRISKTISKNEVFSYSCYDISRDDFIQRAKNFAYYKYLDLSSLKNCKYVKWEADYMYVDVFFAETGLNESLLIIVPVL
jgi:hypothetical protein